MHAGVGTENLCMFGVVSLPRTNSPGKSESADAFGRMSELLHTRQVTGVTQDVATGSPTIVDATICETQEM